MAHTAAGARLVAQFNQQMTVVRDRIRAAVLASFDALGTYRGTDADMFATAVAPIVLSAQQHVAAAAEAYMNLLATIETGTDGAVTANMPTGYARTGVTPDTVYRRPFVTIWANLAAGAPLDAAVATGRARLDATVAADVMLAHRDAATAWMTANDMVTSYRRVTSPTSCALCAAAAHEQHVPDQPMAIHPHCDCTTEPVFRGVTPPPVPVTQPVDNGDPVPRSDLPPVRIVEHGEMGAMLVNADQHFSA